MVQLHGEQELVEPAASFQLLLRLQRRLRFDIFSFHPPCGILGYTKFSVRVKFILLRVNGK